ncbi:MAG TPA: dTMP kinase [Bacteroidota bacterium]|nr:dTMP kinase [Bacteroidota bacterium]
MFITFEGLDFSGKSTQVRLLSERLSQENFNVLVLREPGGTEIGEKIRSILLDKQTSGMTDTSELFLFSASRSQLVEEVIKPALEGGIVVVCDRFYDSTTAYQGWGRGLSEEAIHVINRFATSGISPDVTFFLDLSLEELEKRMLRAKSGKDRMESNGLKFYEKVRECYLSLSMKEKRFVVIDAGQPVEAIQESVWQKIEKVVVQNAKIKGKNE